MIIQSEFIEVPNRGKWQSWKKWVLASVLILLLVGYGWWWYLGNQPITPEQRAQLTALVAQVSNKSGQTTQAVWNRIKKGQSVRRLEEIRRGAFDEIATNLAREL